MSDSSVKSSVNSFISGHVSSDHLLVDRTIHDEQRLAELMNQYKQEAANLVAAVSNSPPTPDKTNPFVCRDELSHLIDVVTGFEAVNKCRFDSLSNQLQNLNSQLHHQNNQIGEIFILLREISTSLRGFRSCECNLSSVEETK
jgi:hypothetical protein